MKGGSCQRRGTPPQLKGTPQEGERGGRRRGGGGTHHGDPVALKKEIGLLSACGLIVGNIIGSGIFVSPKGVLEQVGAVGPALGVWGLSGVLTGLGSLCYAELGVTIPRAGGDYAYVKEVFGGMAGFLRLWIAVLVIYPTNQAVIALTFASYALHPLFQPCPPPQTPLRLLAACCLLLLTWVNCRSVRWATRVQDLFTGGKLLALALIIGTGGVQIARGHTHWLSPARAFLWAEPPSVGGVALGLLQGSFAYGGWNFLNYVTEELRDPPRNLPRAIFISIPLVTSIYLLANVAYLTALAPQDIIASNAVAVTFGERLLGSFSWLMPLAVALSTFGGVNGSLFTCSRLFYAGAREGHLPPLLAMIHVESLTPIPALLLSCVSTLLMLVTGDIYTLINYVGFVNYLWYGVTVGGLLVLRWREPHRPRPLRISLFFPAIYLFFWAALLLFAFWSEPLVCGVGLGIMAGGVPVYILGVRDQKGPPGIHRAMASLSLFGQRLCRVLYPLGGSQEEEEEEEGEGGTPLNPQTHT